MAFQWSFDLLSFDTGNRPRTGDYSDHYPLDHLGFLSHLPNLAIFNGLIAGARLSFGFNLVRTTFVVIPTKLTKKDCFVE